MNSFLMKKISLVMFLFFSSFKALSYPCDIRNGVVSMISILVFSKTTKEQVTNFVYFKVGDTYFAATNYPFISFGCLNENEALRGADSIRQFVDKDKERRFIKKNSKASYKVYRNNDSTDKVMICLQNIYQEHDILFKEVKISTRYATVSCNLYPAAAGYVVCPGVFKENEHLIPISYDKIWW